MGVVCVARTRYAPPMRPVTTKAEARRRIAALQKELADFGRFRQELVDEERRRPWNVDHRFDFPSLPGDVQTELREKIRELREQMRSLPEE